MGTNVNMPKYGLKAQPPEDQLFPDRRMELAAETFAMATYSPRRRLQRSRESVFSLSNLATSRLESRVTDLPSFTSMVLSPAATEASPSKPRSVAGLASKR